jgi:hypothetical protein
MVLYLSSVFKQRLVSSSCAMFTSCSMQMHGV